MKNFTERVRDLVTEWEEAFWNASIDIGETMVAEDINMVFKYVGTIMLAAHTEETFARIERFLEMQMPDTRGAFELTFMGGDSSHARVWVEDFAGFDFGDAWLVDMFPMVSVKHHEWRTWTLDRIQGVVSAVQKDFNGDGHKATVTLIEGEAGQEADEGITLRVDVQDWTLGVFRQNAALKNFVGLLGR